VACRSLLDYECDGAIVAACSLTVPQARTRRHLQGSIFSHDGFCRPFDAAGTGTVKGNGCSVLTLRRLEDARDDHDPILAVIESVAVNNDGRDKVGYTAPSVLGEEEVIREALSLAEVEPSQIDYIEAHGTGTSLGDPIEFRALSRVFDHHVSALPVGSIKANIGHLDAAAGLTSVIKAVHMLDTGVVPPLINLEAVNPEIDNSSDTFSFPTRRTVGQLRHISVSSFGIGGTNAHAIIGSAPAGAAPRARCANTPVIASLSVLRPGDVDAREADLRQAAADLDTWDVAFTAVRNDRGMAYSRIIMLGEFPLVDVTREEILNQIADDGSLDLPLWTACLGCADPGASRQERTREAVELFLAVVLPTSHHKDPSVTSETVAQILDALPGPQDGWWSGPTTPSSRVALTGLLSLVMTCAEPARLSPLFAGTGARLVELPHLRLAVTKHWIGPADDGGDEPRSAAPIRQPASAPGSVLNEVLTAMREVLHVCVAPDDDFFLLGGDSLQAIDVLDRLHVNHPELTLATVLEARTPEGLARVLAHRDTQESGPVNLPSNFTVIRDDADRDDPPVFLIHPAGGTVFQYQVMNTHMHHPSRLVGVSLPANYRDFATLGELAGHYAEQIAAWWPQGPILLAGYSAGGNLAVEAATILAARGRQVATPCLIDSLPPASYRLGRHPSRIPPHMAAMLLDALGVDPTKQSPEMLENQQGISTLLESRGLSPLESEDIVSKWLLGHRLLTYAPPLRFPGDLRVVCAAEPMPTHAMDDMGIEELPRRLWQGHIDGGLSVATVPGNHMSMMSGDNLYHVAAEVDSWIAEVTSEALR